jgi:hypothetical protein
LTLTFPFKAFGRDSFLNDIRSQDHFLWPILDIAAWYNVPGPPLKESAPHLGRIRSLGVESRWR